MKLTRQRQFSIGVLALGLAALAVDRLVLGPSDGGPFPAMAAQGAPGAAPASAPARASVSALGMISVADRLDAARFVGAGARDGFSPPEGWLPKAPSEDAAKHAAKVPEKEGAPDLHLTGLFPTAPGGARAFISGSSVREGDEVHGWRVVKILGGGPGERPGVRLESEGREIVLGIESPMKGRVDASPKAGEKK